MDHVRGSSLAWPQSLDKLRPFIVTWWSGRTIDDMPEDVREVHSQSGLGQRHINMALVVLDENANVLRSMVPRVQPPAFGFSPAAMGRDFSLQLDKLLAGVSVPQRTRSSEQRLTLPEVCGGGQPSGVRIYLTFAQNRLNHYRTPIVEAVGMSEGLKRALVLPANSKTMTVDALRPWLEQMYPAAFMEGMGGLNSLTGDLKISPAGSDEEFRYALINGLVDYELDDRARSRYRGTLTVAVKYRVEDSSLHSVRGVFETSIPKGPELIKMTAAIESTPE